MDVIPDSFSNLSELNFETGVVESRGDIPYNSYTYITQSEDRV